MKSLFARASAGLNLTPGERALLKLVKGIVLTALAAAFTAACQLLGSNFGKVDAKTVAEVAGVTFGVAVCNALEKWASAQGDEPLSVVFGVAANKLDGLNPAKTLASPLPLTVQAPPPPVNVQVAPMTSGTIPVDPASISVTSTTVAGS